MDRTLLSRDIFLVSARALVWFVLGTATSFAVTMLSGRVARYEWLMPFGLLGLLVTLPVAIKSSAVLLHQRFELQFQHLAAVLAMGATIVGGTARMLTYLFAAVLALALAVFVGLGILGLLLIGIRAL